MVVGRHWTAASEVGGIFLLKDDDDLISWWVSQSLKEASWLVEQTLGTVE